MYVGIDFWYVCMKLEFIWLLVYDLIGKGNLLFLSVDFVYVWNGGNDWWNIKSLMEKENIEIVIGYVFIFIKVII